MPTWFARRSLRLAAAALALSGPLAFATASAGHAGSSLTLAEAEAQLAALQNKAGAVDEAYDAMQITLTADQAKAATATAAVTRQAQVVAAAAAATQAFTVSAYESGGINAVTGMLNAGNANSVLQQAADLNEVSRVEAAQFATLQAQRDVLTQEQTTVAQQLAAAQTATNALAADRTSLQNLVADQTDVVNRLQAAARQAYLAQQAAAKAAAAAAAAQAKAAAAAALRQLQLEAEQQAAARAAAAASRSAAVNSAPTPSATSGSTGSPAPPDASVVQIVLAAAYSQLGKPYQWGAAGPDSYDCSGLVMWAFAHAGISLPHSAADQYNYGTHVSLSALEPGDLVFYDDGDSIGHVGIYVGNGDMIDANHTGGWVGVRPLYSDPVGATRIS